MNKKETQKKYRELPHVQDYINGISVKEILKKHKIKLGLLYDHVHRAGVKPNRNRRWVK